MRLNPSPGSWFKCWSCYTDRDTILFENPERTPKQIYYCMKCKRAWCEACLLPTKGLHIILGEGYRRVRAWEV